MNLHDFVNKWKNSTLKERSASQSHFNDLCAVLDEPTPTDSDQTGDTYCFEKGATKDSGRDGWADVWKKAHFAWEYKGKHASLDSAFDQLRQYCLALENPPLLIVSDMHRFRIVTNWTNCVSEKHEFSLDDLFDLKHREQLKWAMSDPEKLRPLRTRSMVTEQAAGKFAELAQSLRDRGHEPQRVAHFVNRLVFCMFAEDVGLLPTDLFSQLLESTKSAPTMFTQRASELFRAMSVGGDAGWQQVDWFNGGLFDDDSALKLSVEEIEITIAAAKLDWSEIDPSILGTLFERGLDPNKRAQLGAHYTDRDKIMRIIDPVISRPLLDGWESVKLEIQKLADKKLTTKTKSTRTRLTNQAKEKLQNFLERLRKFKVLDPACGSGNFLFLALHTLKDLERRVQLEAEALGFQRQFPSVGPENVYGIEINEYAAELAQLSIWIGEIQWMRRNGFRWSTDPILKPLNNIECRDAILTDEFEIPDWPEVDAIIGNPPFLGNRKIRNVLNDDIAETLPRLYKQFVKGKPDLVCYWFARAGMLMRDGMLDRFGFVATNSITGGTNRRVLDSLAKSAVIYDAWADEPWVIDGAAVRVSLISMCKDSIVLSGNKMLDGEEVDEIFTDLTAKSGGVGNDLTKSQSISKNRGTAFQGDIKRGPFDISGELARRWLLLPTNPNGKRNSDVLKPWLNAVDIMRRPRDKWIIDFGDDMGVEDAAMYEQPFEYIATHVKPIRLKTREEKSRKYWYRHWNPRPTMWRAIDKLTRYIATPCVSKYRLFVWCDTRVCPSHALVAFARDDDTTFGILHSRFHEMWSLRLGTFLGKGNDPRYTPTTTFTTFPFPNGLTPDIPAKDNADNPHSIAISDATRELVERRDQWLNPVDLVNLVDEPVAGYPERFVAKDKQAEELLKTRTLTNLYNAKPQWLIDAHTALDEAVANAYGWDNDILEDEALSELLSLNFQQAESS